MIFNRPRRQEKKRLTWYFDEMVTLPHKSKKYHADFTCNGESLIGIMIPSELSMGYVRNSASNFAVYTMGRWKAEKYRTITFEEEPTGDLLAFLEANATPQ